jgi:SAM-dependent methyltransferase
MVEIVGEKGHVTGVDIDEKYIDYCRRLNKYGNVEFVKDDISNNRLIPDGKYDLVFSRFVFVHLRDKVSAVRNMMRMLKKGGKMVIQELDHSAGSWLCYPNDSSVESLRKAYVSLLRKTGGDPLAGRKLYGLMLRESLMCQVDCFSPCIQMGHPPFNSLGWRIMESLKPRLLSKKILSRAEAENIGKRLRLLARRKDAFVAYARLFSVVGSK